MAKLIKKGLGKGLEALLSASNVPVDNMIDNDNGKLREIVLSSITPGKYQPRRVFNELELQELADSIRQNGVIQPIVVRNNGDHYELIAGERRWRAAKIAGLSKIPAVIRSLTDEEALAIALIENIQRKDLNVIEESRAYKRLIDEFNLTHDELAKVTSRSRSHITNLLRLLNLTDEVQEMLMRGELDMGHARALLPLPENSQLMMARKVLADSLTTNEVEKYVASILAGSSKDNGVDTLVTITNKRIDPDIVKLEIDLADKLGMMVNIKHGNRGNGRVTISYASLDELDNLLKYLN